MLPTGCAEQNDSVDGMVQSGGTAIRFGVQNSTMARVDFATDPVGALNVTWNEGDQIGISATKGSDVFGCNYLYNVEEVGEEGSSAHLAASSNIYAYHWADEDNYTFFAYYPFRGVQNEGVHYLANVSLPEVQEQKAMDDFSHLKELWAMKAEPYAVNGVQNSINLSFRGLYSIVELKLKYSAPLAKGERPISRVRLASTTAPLAAPVANLSLDTSGEADLVEGALIVNEGEGVNSVDVMLERSAALATEQTQSVWLVVLPGTHAAGELSLQLETLNSYRLDVTLEDGVTFEPNKVYRKEIAINPEDFEYYRDPNAPAVTYYKPVTALEDITSGEYIIGFDFKDETVGDMWLKLVGATRNPVAAAYDEAAIEPYADLGILSVVQDFVWTLTQNGDGFNISAKDKEGTEWLLNGCNKAQGISIATTVTGHYKDTETYSNLWYIKVAEETGEFYIQNETSNGRYLVVDTVNGNQWRNGGNSPVENGTFVFYKKVTE